MPDISAREISELIRKIYSGGSSGEFGVQCLNTMATRFRSTCAALVINSNSNERNPIFASVGFDEPRLRGMISGGHSSGLPFLDANEFPADQAFTLCAMHDDNAESSMGQRQRSFFLHGGRHTLIGMVANGPSHQSLVWFSRDDGEGEYLQRERDELELILPHLRQVTEFSDDSTDLHMRLDMAKQVMNRTPFGMFFLNVHGTWLYGNSRAHSLLASKDGLLIRDGKLTLRNEGQRKQFDTIFEDFRNSPDSNSWPRDRLSVKRSTGDSPYLMVIIPMTLKPSSSRLHDGKVILVQVHDPAGVGKGKVDGLEKFYNLTAAEAEVCQRLYEKKCLSSVAKELGVSVNTAKTHLIRSFRKIGVSSQAELLQQLAVHPKYGW